jgi:hypothetical protein
MKSLLILCFALLLSLPTWAQFGFEYNDSIPVINNGQSIKMPWAGGLSYAQFSDIDVDFDGDLDLFVFDRSSDNIRVFTQEIDGSNKYYKLLYNGHLLFPADIRYRATTADYNNDGKMDIFCYGIGGIKVYKNIGDATNGLQWEVASELLYSDNWGANLNLYVSSSDIPAISDVDQDGDLDVLTFHIGGQHLQYHKNLSMETYGVPDSLKFKLMNECWGGFREDINTNSIFLFDTTPPCTDGNIPNAESPTIDNEQLALKPTEQTPKHSGSTVTALDYDNDGVMDLILGDVAFHNMNLLINGGNLPNENSDMISVDPLFPSNSAPVDIEIFPAAFIVDVDFDGVKDLVVGTNARNVSANEKSVWFYKNTGSNDLPNFVYQTDAFLQKEMIEHGTGSIPALVDIDNDGLMDLFVGNFFRHLPDMLKESSIAFYKNTGTSTEAEYTFIDDNFMNLSQNTYGLRMYPAFGDLTGDGLQDLIIGREDGTLVYLRNTSSLPGISFAAPVVNLTDNNGTIITAGSYASPQLFDLNMDGLLDLVIGKKTGEIMYYQNIGTTSTPSFQLKNATLGGVDIATDSPDGYAAPHFFKHNDTVHLFLGGVSGTLYYYKDIEDNLESGAFTLVSSSLLDISVGSYSNFAVYDVDNDGNLNMFVGQDLGGVYHFEVVPGSTAGLKPIETGSSFMVYPNPTKGQLTVKCSSESEMTLELADLFGKSILNGVEFSNQTEVDLSNLPSGVYLLKLTDPNGNQITKRVIRQ